jgi:hypothetical protein
LGMLAAHTVQREASEFALPLHPHQHRFPTALRAIPPPCQTGHMKAIMEECSTPSSRHY